MSGAVDTKTVEMRFDNSNFESNVKTSMSTLAKLKSALKLDGASKGLSDIEKASKKLDFKDLGNSVEATGKKFNILETIATGVFLRIGMQAAEAGEKLIKSFTIDQLSAGWSKYEQKTTSVQTIMANLRDTTGKFVDEASKMDYVNEQIEKLNWFSDETSYSLTDMTDNIGKFIANGQDLEDSVQAMQGIATWAAISGQNSQTAARAMYNISQAMGTGAMKNIDWKSIENANMATAEFKETAIGIALEKGKIKEGQVTIENFRDSLNKGWFDKEVMMETFKTYGAAVDKVKQTMEESERSITASQALQIAAAKDPEFAKSLAYRAFKAAQEAKTFSDAMTATGDAVSSKWMGVFENIFGNYLQQRVLWTDLANAMWDVFAAPIDNLNEIFSVWNKGFDGVSGRTHLIEGVSNVLNTLFHTTYTEEGEIDRVSIFDTIKNGLKEVMGLDPETEFEDLGKSLWNLTKRFYDFTESIKPSEETLAKIKNSFKGLFTIFKIGGKFVSAIIKPFKDLFGSVFPGGLSALLDISSGFGDFIQRFDNFLEESQVFQTISDGISWGLMKIGEGFDWVAQKLAGVSFSDFVDNIKKKVLNFFQNTDFGKLFGSIGAFFSNIINQIKQVETSDILEKLTPVQEFYLAAKKVFGAILVFFGAIGKGIGKAFTKIVEFFSSVGQSAKTVGEWFKNFFTAIKEAFSEKITEGIERVAPILEGIKNIFKGFIDFITSIGSTFQKVGDWIGTGLSKIGAGLAKFLENKSATEIIEGVIKGGFFVALTRLITSLAGLNRGAKGVLKAVTKDLLSVKGVLKAYRNEVNASAILEIAMAIGVLSGSLFLLSKIEADKLESALSALKTIAIIIGAFVALKAGINWLTSKIEKSGGKGKETIFDKLTDMFTGVIGASIYANDASMKFLKVAAGIALLAAGVYIVSKSLKNFSEGIMALGENADKDQFKKGLEVLAYIAGGISILSLFSGLGHRGAASALIAVLAGMLLVKAAVKMVNVMSELGDTTNMSSFKKGLFIVGMFGALFTAFNAFNNFGPGQLASSIGILLVMLSLVALVKTIADSLTKLAKQAEEPRIKAAGKMIALVGGVLLGAVALFAIIQQVGKRSKSILSAALGIVAAALAVRLIAESIAGLASFGSADIKTAGIVLGALIAVLGLVVGLLSIRPIKTLASVFGLLLATVAVFGLATSVAMLATVDTTSMVLAGIVIAALIAVLGLYVGLNGLNPVGTIVAAASLVVATLGVFVLALSLAMLASVNQADLEHAATVLGSMIIVLTLMTVIAGLVGGAALLGSAALLVASAAVLVLAAALVALSAIDLMPVADGLEQVGLSLLPVALGALAAGAAALVLAVGLAAFAVAAVAAAVAAALLAAGVALLGLAIGSVASGIDSGIDGLAGLADSIPGIGGKIADAIRGWKGDVDGALSGVFGDAESIFSSGAESAIDGFLSGGAKSGSSTEGFSGGGGGRSFADAGEQGAKEVLDSSKNYFDGNAKTTGEKAGKDITDGMSESIDTNSPKIGDSGKVLMDLLKTVMSDGSAEGLEAFNLDFLSGLEGSIDGFDMLSLMNGKMGDMSSAITDGSGDSYAAIESLIGDLSGSIEGFDASSLMSGKMGDFISAITGSSRQAGQAAKEVSGEVEANISSFDAFGSGSDMSKSYGAGIRASSPIAIAAATALANAVHAILHFSEPDEGPLSDFHTYAPDMIKLWCKGIYDNLGQVEDSSDSIADTVYDGFSTALDYVSDLIDNGMSDELAIRPVMDLSAIQNGMNNLDSMMSGANGYTVTGTARLASVTASGINSARSTPDQPQAVSGGAVNNYNTFNIVNDDPNTVAQKVSKILNQDARREQYVWAR